MSRRVRMAPMALALGGALVAFRSSVGDAASGPPASTCTIAPDKTRPVAAQGRDVYCAIDLGSRNVKLFVDSLEPGRPLTIRDDRSCRARLNLGTKVYDAAALGESQDRPLAAADIDDLVATIKEFREICALDGGRMVGADATEWARHATNLRQVQEAVAAKAGVEIEVLGPDQEALYGYAAATRNQPGRIVLDPGSSSFQVTAQPMGEKTPTGVSVPLGYEQASNLHFVKEVRYEEARAAYAKDVKTRLAPELARLRAGLTGKKLRPALIVMDQSGSVSLALHGSLRDRSGRWVADETGYNRLVNDIQTQTSPEYGEISALFKALEIKAYLASLDAPDQLRQLRADPALGLYGNKVLVVPALLDTLANELRLDTIVIVPVEMPTGYILAKLTS